MMEVIAKFQMLKRIIQSHDDGRRGIKIIPDDYEEQWRSPHRNCEHVVFRRSS